MSDRLSRKRNVDSAHGSRDSSCSSQVRCGCQYFQTDSLLPEKQSLIGLKPNITTIMNTLSKTNDKVAPTPESETADSAASVAAQPGHTAVKLASVAAAASSNVKIGDHDYEPITPMSTNRPTPPPILKVPSTSSDAISNDKGIDASSSKEKQYLKLPPDDEIISADADEDFEEEEEFDEEEMEEEEEEEFSEDPEEDDEGMTAEELQAQMEERFFNQAGNKSAIPVMTKTQPGTSAAKTPSLSKPEPAQAQTFQQKLKTQADKFKSTFQTMSKRKEAPKEETEANGSEGEPPAKTKFQLPKRPKFDRSKFKLPDRPKLKMPERAKFKMPDRPKFKMPERPKFNFPDKAKFKLPDRPKIQLPNLKLPKRSNSFKEGDSAAGTSAVGSKKNLFDFKTYPRIFNKRKREENGCESENQIKTESIPAASSAPSTPLWKRSNLTQKWGQMITELKSKDFNKKMKPNDDTHSQSSSGFKPRTFPGNESLDDSEIQKTRSASSGLDTDKEQHSSGASSLRERKGVLEEINSDEFFLREKGLSRDNVDVSQFLTREIRDAFNADAGKEESEFEDEEEVVTEEIPQKESSPPRRSKSFSRFISRFHKKDKKELEEKKDQYKTYPPRKSERKKRDSELFLVIPLKDENDPEFEPSIPVNDHTDEDYEIQRQVFKAIPKPKQDSLQVPEPEKRSRTPDEKKEQTVTQTPQNDKENIPPTQKVVEAQIENPTAPRRKRSLTQSLKSEGILKDVDNNKDNKSLRSIQSGMEPEQGLHQYPTPVAPRRRSRSLGTSLTSEDRTSRGADSMPSEEHEETVGYAIVEKTSPPRPETPPRSKPPRPPPPCRRRRTFNIIRDQGLSNFFTFPRRKSYVEDMPIIEKSYSTLGPTRPPRRSRSRNLREPLYADGSIHSDMGYIDNESETKSLDHHIEDFVDDFKPDYGGSLEDKDLQSDDVIEKMKGRPLPAPPRPPRKTKQDGEDDSDIEDIEQDAQLSGTTPPIDNIAVNLHTEDISIAIQTDPLTDEYIVTNNEEVNTADKVTRVVPLKGERKSLHQKTSEDSKKAEQLNNLDAPTLPLRRDRRSLSKDDIKTDVKILNTSPTQNIETTTVLMNPQQSFVPIDEFCRQQAAASRPIQAQAAPHDSPRPPPRRPPSGQRDTDSDKREIERIVERQVIVIPGPESEVTVLKAQKLQVQELDVNRIHVNELQASRITVHDVDSDVINVSRINSSSGNLIIDNIELPSDILQSISQSITGATMPSQRSQLPPSDAEHAKQDHSIQVSPAQQSTQSQTQATSSSHESTQTKPDSSDPVRPTRRRSSPDYSVPVPKYFRTRKYSYDSDEVMIVPIPVPRVRRRHHHASDAAASSSTRDDSEQDSALDLGRRFVNVVGSDIMSLIQTFIQQIPRGEKQQQRDVVQMFICIFITIFALFFLMGFGSGSKTIHTHHWDYQFPPPPP